MMILEEAIINALSSPSSLRAIKPLSSKTAEEHVRSSPEPPPLDDVTDDTDLNRGTSTANELRILKDKFELLKEKTEAVDSIEDKEIQVIVRSIPFLETLSKNLQWNDNRTRNLDSNTRIFLKSSWKKLIRISFWVISRLLVRPLQSYF